MGRTKGSKNKAKALTSGVSKIDDLQYEVAILKAAVKQLIRESRDWRIKNEKAIDVLTDRCQRHLLAGYDNGDGADVHRSAHAGVGCEPGRG